MRADGDFDGKKHTIPAELFPRSLQVDGVPFAFGPATAGREEHPRAERPDDHAACRAISIGSTCLPTRSAATSPRPSRLAASRRRWIVREWQGPIGQWWSRLTDIAPSLHEPFAVQNGNNGLVVDWDPKTRAS